MPHGVVRGRERERERERVLVYFLRGDYAPFMV